MFKLSCPGKIFLAGEYLALKGGGSLALCVEPRFELLVRELTSREVQTEIAGIPKGSPADRYIDKNREFFKKLELSFVDPYMGRGGFGASSAQFLLVYFLRNEFHLALSPLMEAYHNNSWDGQGWAPSGADVLAQSCGGLVFGSRTRGVLEQLPWPFPDLDFVAFSTGTKIPTHEHLKTLSDFSEESLSMTLSRIEGALREPNRVEFLNGIREWAEEFVKRGWVHGQTLESLKILQEDQRVLAVKGCGALGADVILVFLESQERDGFLKDWRIGKFGLKILNSFSRVDISQGIQWKTL
jgi:mevalonate kinase